MRNPIWVRDEVILALDLYLRSGRRQLAETHEEVVLLSGVMRMLPIHSPESRDPTFRNPAGISMVLGNFLGIDPEHVGTGLGRHNHLQQEVWDQFAGVPERLREIARSIVAASGREVADAIQVEEGECFPEGRILTSLHFRRERSRRIVEKKRQHCLSATGRLACEVCAFDFAAFYGSIGRGYAECHHIRPLSELPFQRQTRLQDLAIVCANCHRMLHRARPVLTPNALRSAIEQQNDRVPGGV